MRTDVIESGLFGIEINSCSSNPVLVDRVRPATGGYSIGLFNMLNSSSISCLVKDSTNIYILGNNHSIVDLNKAQIVSAILQPSLEDGGIIGRDTNTVVKVVLQGQIYMFVNAIIARIPTEKGDSGAVLLDLNNNAIGHLIGGEINSEFACFSPLISVLNDLDVMLVT